MVTPRFPLIIHGTVSSSSQDKQVGLRVMKLTNLTTGDTLPITTNEDGVYVADAANFTNGYTVGDVVEIEANNASPTYDTNIDITNGDIRLQ